MKYLHIIEQCNTDIWQGNIIVMSSVGDTRHSHSQKTLPSFLKSGDTVNAQLHNATYFTHMHYTKEALHE
jgi:hypothetical protein